jgi:antitoxin component YwqK of YwqJK toxin-antitoxin module
MREGPATEYYPNRNVRFRGYYVAGKLDGNESIFNEAGIETLRILWKDGQQVSSLRCPCVSP